MALGFGRKERDVAPDDLRERLLAAIQADDFDTADRLLTRYGNTIRTTFAEWRKPPAHVLSDPTRWQQYVRGLWIVAQVFERRGDRSLVAALTDGSPFEKWNNCIGDAKRLTAEGRTDEAMTVLNELLTEIEGIQGNAAEHYRPAILGSLGVALAKAGRREEAIATTRRALDLCRATGDEEGIKAYTNNLKILGTFDIPRSSGDRSVWTVAVEDDSGNTLTEEQWASEMGHVKWEVHGGPEVPPKAKALHQAGRDAGQRKDFETALRLFTEAAALAPAWPYPIYDRAFTHLLQGDLDAALADYNKVLQLAPEGFYAVRQFIDMVTRERAGEFPNGFTTAFDAIQWLPAEKQEPVLRQVVERFPSCAAGWAKLVQFESDLERRLQMVEKGLAAPGDVDTHGTLQVLKAWALAKIGRVDDSTALLSALQGAPSTSTRVMAELVRRKLHTGG
jgi:tetratricopeptide (TPR) repeat protein